PAWGTWGDPSPGRPGNGCSPGRPGNAPSSRGYPLIGVVAAKHPGVPPGRPRGPTSSQGWSRLDTSPALRRAGERPRDILDQALRHISGLLPLEGPRRGDDGDRHEGVDVPINSGRALRGIGSGRRGADQDPGVSRGDLLPHDLLFAEIQSQRIVDGTGFTGGQLGLQIFQGLLYFLELLLELLGFRFVDLPLDRDEMLEGALRLVEQDRAVQAPVLVHVPGFVVLPGDVDALTIGHLCEDVLGKDLVTGLGHRSIGA